ncbi:MAG: phage virion morphogenesis protein [Alteromonadaceae bacterium]|uniref:phage virion morphogenesis protein n=1 Tax=Paraglaciecola chathamensis TaxID=368405 RepID=UPI000C40F73B|nr:phage virion morphogenesis protein [Paraglaciecola agarilytica]MBN26267.1 phage virion morphogenesis protein [Alteromonadaceae bacterium]|tara:strand:- start:94708 stop:95154 length:447 start_codon:yes stop_codon:yes gene_type:complete
MAGSFIKVELTNEKPLINLLTSYIKQGQSLEPALAEIGEYLIESHQERFQLEVEPDGTPWEPLSPKTIKQKGGDDRILQSSDTMRDQLAYQLSGNELEFGSNLEYAATHQFGREADGIVARPFIGLATGQWNDVDEIVAILQGHLSEN